MFGRDTKWRQGSVVNHEDAIKVGLINQDSSKCVVVISHDCDIPNQNESAIEVIIGDVKQQQDLGLIRARNPRKLHLRFETDSGELKCVELNHSEKCAVDKSDLDGAAPCPNHTLDDAEKLGLKQWLAARYGRPAFPNEFDGHLKSNRVHEFLAKKMDRIKEHVIGLFFDLGEDRNKELKDDAYNLRIIIAYDAENIGAGSREVAENAAKEITEHFHKIFGEPDQAKGIALERCTAVADSYVTLADLRKMDQWALEYLSLRETTPGDYLAVGRLPG